MSIVKEGYGLFTKRSLRTYIGNPDIITYKGRAPKGKRSSRLAGRRKDFDIRGQLGYFHYQGVCAWETFIPIEKKKMIGLIIDIIRLSYVTKRNKYDGLGNRFKKERDLKTSLFYYMEDLRLNLNFSPYP